jgi:hypothetical protein
MRLVVYTAIFCGRDELKQPAHTPEGVDFVCFTEANMPGGSWQVRPPGRILTDPARAVRYHKLCPFRVLPGYDSYIWLDGSLELTGDPRDMAAAGGELGLFPHRQRDCAFAEAEVVVETTRAPARQVRNQMDCYRRRGFPSGFGLWEAGAMVRRNTRRIRALCDTWWEQVRQHTCRDQLSLPYSLWSQKLSWNTLRESVSDNPWLRLHDHEYLPHSEALEQVFGTCRDHWPAHAQRYWQQAQEWRTRAQV